MGDSEDDTMPLGGETVGTAYVRLHILGDDLDREVRREIRKTTNEFNDAGHEQGGVFGDAFTQEFVRRFRSHLDRMGNDPNTTRSVRRFSDTIGRLFGRGARNNFLNFTGSFARGIARMGEVLADLPSIISNVTSKFRALLSTLGSGGGGGAGALGGGGEAAAAGLIVTVWALVEAFGQLGSLASGLGGFITALASSLSFGLAGALTAVGGSAFYAGTGLGVVILAIKNLSDAQKKQLQPIADAFGDLGDAAAKSFGPVLIRNVDGITAALERLEEPVRVVGEAMGHVLDGLVDSLNGPAWRRFIRTFTKEAPGIIEDLGGAFTNFGEVFAGVLNAATPLTRRFAHWLEVASGHLSDWVNSAKGQDALTDFFDQAEESARVLGRLLGKVAESLFTIFDAGNESGNNILNSLADALDRFNEWAKSKEGQKALKDWFKFAEDLAGKLGEIFLAVIDFLDDLDTDEHRKELLKTLDVVERLIRAFDTVFTTVDKFFHADLGRPDWFPTFEDLGNVLRKIGQAFGNIDWGKVFGNPLSVGFWNKFLFGTSDPIGQIKNRFSGAASKISQWIGDVDWSKVFQTPWPRVNSLVAGMARRIGDAIGDVNWGAIFSDPWAYLRGKVAGLAGKIGDAMGNVNWGDVFTDPWEWVKDKVSGLGGRIADAIGSIDLTVNIDWPDPPGWFSKLLSASPGGTAIVLGSSASGGVFDGAQARIIGEAGPEAVVPLRRPLGQVDPAVRELSAFAQGLTVPWGRPGRQQTNNFYVTTPTRDPHAVAVEVVNRLTAVGGF